MKTRTTVFALLLAGIAALSAPAQTNKAVRLNPPGSSYTTAAGINKNGNVVGVFELPGQTLQGFAYVASTKKYKLIAYPGALYTTALGINDGNTIVGTFAGTDGVTHGFFLVHSSQYTQYDVSGITGADIHSINNAGDFAGTAGANGFYQGYVSVGGTVTTFLVNGAATDAYGINSSDSSVGFFVKSDFSGTHGFLRDAAGNITQIDYPGSVSTACTGINDAGTITGVYEDNLGVNHGFILENGNYRTAGFPYLAAINNNGVFVGSFVSPAGETFGFFDAP